VFEGLNKWYKLINQFVVSSGSKILNEKIIYQGEELSEFNKPVNWSCDWIPLR